MGRYISCSLAIAIVFGALNACERDDENENGVLDGSHAPSSGMLIDIVVSGVPELLEPLTVSFTYRVDPESGWELPDTLIATSYVQAFRPMFELLSNDSTWTDTLYIDQSRTHSFVMRPLSRGAKFSCTLVSSRIDESLTIGASECVLIDTP